MTKSRSLRFVEWLSALSGRTALLMIPILLAAISIADWLTGQQVAFSLFYVLPLLLASFALAPGWGFGVAFACALLSFGLNLLHGRTYPNAFLLVWSAGMRLAYFLAFAALANSLRSALDELREESIRDPLTKAANWRFFEEYYRLASARARREGLPISAAFFDVDDFKKVNDEIGHAAGDDVLRTVGTSVLQGIRAEDCLARLGGDEFAIVLFGLEGRLAEETLDRLLGSLRREEKARGHDVTFSVGLGTWKEAPPDVASLLAAIDPLMYEVKRSGKGRVLRKDFGPVPAPSTG